MKIKIFEDYKTLSKATANLIKEYVTTKANSLICLASGHTPIGVFQEIAKEVNDKTIDLSKCTFLSLDEWIGIDPSDSGTCLTMLKKDCFEPMKIAEHQIEFFNVKANDLQEECDRINSLIKNNGGLDIMLVGVGINGHIGMNEPGTSFDSYAHTGELAEETKTVGQKYFDKATELSMGITLGLGHLRESKLPIIMANGTKKSYILAKGLIEPPTEEVPLSIAQLIPQGYIMLDEEAASQLKK
jgi:glucosamine-6-phosphate isomerase